jgi:hypothetical protein
MFGEKHFGFVPLTFILPKDFNQLEEQMELNREKWWIVKPSASS